jgi:hypothetical protein
VKRYERWIAVAIFCTAFAGIYRLQAQMNQSGGPGANVNATQAGTWTVNPGNTANSTAWKVDGSAVTQPVSAASLPLPSGAATAAKQPALGTAGSAAADVITVQGIAGGTAQKVDGSAVTQPVSLAALPAGTNMLGLIRAVPSSCTGSTPFASSTVGVGTGAGTSLTSTATCATFAYANNITNSPVTLRIQDKSGTPIIWFGGNGDFTIPANSNIRIPIDGVNFVAGITAIAGTGSAINLQVNGLQ